MDVIKKVDYSKIIKKTGLSLYRLERETGIGYITLKRLRDNDTNVDPQISTHNRLAKFINKLSKSS